MNILLVTHYYSTHAGGIEIVAGILADRLSAQHQINWVASDCDPIPGGLPESVSILPMRSINAIERRTGLPFPIWGLRSLIRLWREVKRADLVHLHDVAYPGNWAAFAFAKLQRTPVVVTQHVGFIPFTSPVLRFALHAMHITIGRLILGGADQVIFISPVVRDYYSRFVRFGRPPLVVSNGVDTNTFVPPVAGDRERARAALGLDAAGPTMLFVGRFVEKKGLQVLEGLARGMPDLTWLFAGWGPIDPEGWDLPNVRVFRDRRGGGLVPLYHAADLLVLPSVGEGLPLVVQEAMSCGTPALVGEDTGEAVGAPDTVFAARVGGHLTTDIWEAKVRRILAELPRRPELSKRASEFARRRWSWTACARSYETLFRALARP
jgi:glycosyltransferase involved in cell wall biosynthesis